MLLEMAGMDTSKKKRKNDNWIDGIRGYSSLMYYINRLGENQIFLFVTQWLNQ